MLFSVWPLNTVPLQRKVILFCLQVPLYAINQHLVVDKLNALDVGGSITIHAFGAYYGLAASLVLSISGSGADHHKNSASYSSDMTAMIGTIFLWLFWVSDLSHLRQPHTPIRVMTTVTAPRSCISA